MADFIGEQVGKQIPQPVRKLVAIAYSVLIEKTEDYFTTKDLVLKTGLDKSTISRNLRKALKHGLVEYHETSKKRNQKFIIGTPIGDDNSVFPSPTQLKEKIGSLSENSLQLCNLDPNMLESYNNIVARTPATNENECNRRNQNETDNPLVAIVADQSGSCRRSCNQNYQENQQVKPLVAWLHNIEGSEVKVGDISSVQGLPCETAGDLGTQVRFDCSQCEGPCMNISDPAISPARSEVKPTTFAYDSASARIRIA